MRITFKTETVKLLETFLSQTSSTDELEFRLGKIFNDKFVPGIRGFIFNNLINQLKGNTSSLDPENYENVKTVVSYYNNYIRKIETIKNNAVFAVEYQRKKSVLPIDLKLNVIDIRLSRATETKITSIQNLGEIKYKRERDRHIFKYNDYVIELTKIKSLEKDIIYEVEIEYKKIPKLKELIAPLKKILILLFPERIYLFERDEYLNVVSNYNKTLFFIKSQGLKLDQIVRYGNKPRNIKREDIIHMKNYSATNKLNGISYDLLFSNTGIHLVNFTDIDKISGNPLNEINNTLLHGEWYQNVYHVFDISIYKGENISNKPHDIRRNYAEKVIDIVSKFLEKDIDLNVKVQLKIFSFTHNLENDTLDIMRYMYNTYSLENENVLDANDGIIFTPNDLPFMNRHTLKYKFIHTIDFRVSDEKKDKKGDVSSLKENKIFKLEVYGENNKLIIFNGKLFVSNDDKLYNDIQNGMIVECVFNNKNKYFTPMKIRYDKDMPNFITVANDIFSDIIKPIALDDLLLSFHKIYNIKHTPQLEREPEERRGEKCDLTSMRKYHNIQKKILIDKYAKNKKILDLGFGFGGDIHKYETVNINFILGIEPNKENIKEAKRRLLEKSENFRKKVKILNAKAQENILIQKELKKYDIDKVDIVSAFFSLTFFFESENDLQNLMNTISSNLKIGGKFIGTTMDGDKTYEFFKGKNKIEEQGCFTMIKMYNDASPKEIGQKIQINLEKTIVNNQDEYLVYFDIFVKEMEKWGLYLIETQEFNPPQYIPQNVRNFSKLFRSFVFERRISEKEKKVEENKKKNEEILKIQIKNKLDMASIDENLSFDNNFDPNTQLVRTGTIGDGSCLFHTIIRSIDHRYTKLSKNERIDFMEKLRKMLSDNLTYKMWIKLGNGSLAYNIIIPIFIKKNNEYANIEANNIIDYKNKLSSENDKEIFDKISNKQFKLFIEKLKDPSAWVGEDPTIGSLDVFEYISDFLNIDIYLMRDTTRMPYRQAFDCALRYKNRPSIIILWTGSSHYECVGRLTKKGIERVFDFDDPLILKINQILC